MAYLRFKCITGFSGFSDIRETFRYFSSFYGTGYSDAFLLPSLLIIPFIILSRKLTEKVNEIRLLQLGLVIFALSGILYLLSNKMWQLIAVSFNGNRISLIKPLSTGLISRFFIGKYRTKQFGLSSAITKCNVGISHDLNGISGGGELAFTVCRLSIALDFHRTFRILEKEYGE